MALPLLVFPHPRAVSPQPARGFPRNQPHFPGHSRQKRRLRPQLEVLQQDFACYKASMSDTALGIEPETTLVIEIVGTVDKFAQAIEKANLEWLGEWDREAIEPDEDFYDEDASGMRRRTSLKGQLFLSMANESGLRSLLKLWNLWRDKRGFPHGEKKWRLIFDQMQSIRRWGVKDSLIDTGMIQTWGESVSSDLPNQAIFCQIELFFRKDAKRRKRTEQTLTRLLEESGGQIRSEFLEIPSIGLHAVKAQLSDDSVLNLLNKVDAKKTMSDGPLSPDISTLSTPLFKYHEIMYFRPTGQNLTTMTEESGVPAEFPEGKPELSPTVAILDGVPNQMHDALKNRVVLDDRDGLSGQYPVGKRRHGTAMASLIIHGDTSGLTFPLNREVYCRPIMQYNEKSEIVGECDEYVPPDIFIEDRVERAVRQMLDRRDGNSPPAPDVKVINFSIGIRGRPFQWIPSPLAMLLDWLSWKYRVLFCVSAGNYDDRFDLGVTYQEFSKLSEQDQVEHTLRIITKQLAERRLISPAESLNSVTVGALHVDESKNDGEPREQRFDLLPSNTLFSPISRFGLGFRRSVKPEVFFPAGRQFYEAQERIVCLSDDYSKPGQRTAWDSPVAGELSKTVYTRGTSNATALATRSAARIYDVLLTLQEEHKAEMPENLAAVLIKTLLVHGAEQSDEVKSTLRPILASRGDTGKLKELLSRFLGYGAVDVERVLSCTEQRATVIACGEIDARHMHEYQFPLPNGLSGRQLWRRMTVTLAWFSPINPKHRNYRMAKLDLEPQGAWQETPLHLSERPNSDYHQVKRGTVQHEILEGEKMIAPYEQGDHLELRVLCKADATETLEDSIPYGLAVTLEVAEGVNVPIYSQIRDEIRLQVPVEASPGSQDA